MTAILKLKIVCVCVCVLCCNTLMKEIDILKNCLGFLSEINIRKVFSAREQVREELIEKFSSYFK